MAAQERHSGVGLLPPPPLLYALSFLLAVGLQRWLPLGLPDSPLLRILSAALALVALALGSGSLGRFRVARTTFTHLRPSTALVVSGPYRFSRNPMYVGLSLLYLAIAFWWGLLWPVILLPLPLAVLNWWIIPAEERQLQQRFPAEYELYMAKVRRWF